MIFWGDNIVYLESREYFYCLLFWEEIGLGVENWYMKGKVLNIIYGEVLRYFFFLGVVVIRGWI